MGRAFPTHSRTCADPDYFDCCPLPRHDMRNGRLNQLGYSLYLFVRDVAEGDLVGWIDERLRQANPGTVIGRLSRMRDALIGPLRHVYGVSDKVLSMALSDLLIAAPRTKQYWFETGASMIVIDSLVHNWLHRTGILRRSKAQHPYGAACYRPDGCADIIERAAKQIDARKCNRIYPGTFPRWVQHALWSFCAQEHLDICNGNQIDDRKRCRNVGCLLFQLSELVANGVERFNYSYDFGDGWQHRIVVEKIMPADSKMLYPQFLGGERRCPPEDCGGVPGYYEFLKNIASKQGRKRKVALDWYGRPYDPHDIEEKQIAAALKRIADSMPKHRRCS